MPVQLSAFVFIVFVKELLYQGSQLFLNTFGGDIVVTFRIGIGIGKRVIDYDGLHIRILRKLSLVYSLHLLFSILLLFLSPSDGLNR